MRQGLDGIALERVREELVKIFSTPGSASVIRMMDKDNLLTQLLPECEPMRDLLQNDYHHKDVWQHSLSALESLESLLAQPRTLFGRCAEEAVGVLSQELADGRSRQSLLKLGVLIHDMGKPASRSVDAQGGVHFYGHEVVGQRLAASLCSRLRFSNREIDFVSRLVGQHMRLVHLFKLERGSAKSLSRFFRLGSELFWPLLFLFAADYSATLGVRSSGGNMILLGQRIHSWLDYYYRALRPRELDPPLVNGHDLMEHLNLPASPLLGKLLDSLSQMQWEGRISSREEALSRASELLEKGA
jgi:tRNA nucleotidyltransferase/poly(A) polymerase